MADIIFKILLVGDASVGKTSLMLKFVDNHFENSYSSTIGLDYQTKIYNYKGYNIKLQIWDTAGQERFHSITSNFFHNADGILFIYDITNRNSFEGIKNWMKESEEIDNSLQKILLGNKCDLNDSRDVQKEEVEKFCNENNIDLFETSAKDNINLEEAFKRIIELVFKTKEAQNLLKNKDLSSSLIINDNIKKNNNAKCC